MTKELTPLRKKDIETGRKLEREAVVEWLRASDFKWLAIAIKSGEHLK